MATGGLVAVVVYSPLQQRRLAFLTLLRGKPWCVWGVGVESISADEHYLCNGSVWTEIRSWPSRSGCTAVPPIAVLNSQLCRSYLHRAGAHEPCWYWRCVNIPPLPHYLPVFPPRGENMWRKNPAIPHRLGPINAHWEKQSLFITSGMFRQGHSRICSTHVDLSLCFLLSRGWRRRVTDARINNAEDFAVCVIFPKEMCYQAALHTYFVIFLLF